MLMIHHLDGFTPASNVALHPGASFTPPNVDRDMHPGKGCLCPCLAGSGLSWFRFLQVCAFSLAPAASALVGSNKRGWSRCPVLAGVCTGVVPSTKPEPQIVFNVLCQLCIWE